MEEITPLLRELTAQMNTTVEFLWGVMVRQAGVYAISYVAYFLLWLFTFFADYKLIKKFAENIEGEPEGMQIPQLILAVVLGLVLFVAFIGLASEFGNFLTALLNPEYWALQQILEYIK